MYSTTGRPSVPPERLLKAMVMSSEHFSVDGTLIEAWASMKSFRPKDDDDGDNNGWGDFRGSKRSNETHESKTDPEARLARRGWGKESRLCFSAHALMENRSGLLVDFQLAEASPKAEPRVALEMLGRSVRGTHRVTVGADRAYDQRGFVRGARELNVTPHVAQFGQRGGNRGSAIDGRTVRHRGYRQSLLKRMRVEEIFGWMKSSAHFARSRWRGLARTQLMGHMVAAAYNLLRMGKLLAEAA